jgi:hypothetical protein
MTNCRYYNIVWMNAGACGSVVWLRHYATTLMVAGSIPDEVIPF